MTPVGTRSLHDLRRFLLDPPRELRTPTTTGGDTDQIDPFSAIEVGWPQRDPKTSQ